MEFFGNPHGGDDIIGAVRVDAALSLASHDRHKFLKHKAAFGLFFRVAFSFTQFVRIIERLIQDISHDCRNSHARHRHFVLFNPVNALGIFAHGEFHGFVARNDNVENG